MIILDTDVLTIIQRGRGAEFEPIVAFLDRAADEVFITIISFEEQMRGWLAAVAKSKSIEAEVAPYSKLRELLEDFQARPILDFDAAAAAVFANARRARIRVPTMDLKIAAIAIANDALLLTQNRGDFRKIPGVRLVDWRV